MKAKQHGSSGQIQPVVPVWRTKKRMGLVPEDLRWCSQVKLLHQDLGDTGCVPKSLELHFSFLICKMGKTSTHPKELWSESYQQWWSTGKHCLNLKALSKGPRCHTGEEKRGDNHREGRQCLRPRRESEEEMSWVFAGVQAGRIWTIEPTSEQGWKYKFRSSQHTSEKRGHTSR